MQWRATLILFLLQSVCDNDFRYKREPLASRTLDTRFEEIKTRALLVMFYLFRLSITG